MTLNPQKAPRFNRYHKMSNWLPYEVSYHYLKIHFIHVIHSLIPSLDSRHCLFLQTTKVMLNYHELCREFMYVGLHPQSEKLFCLK